jgi:glycosyltransferase involved in cell wall biosynthesis
MEKSPASSPQRVNGMKTMKDSAPAVCFVRHWYFPNDVRVLKQAKTLRDAGFSVDVICLRDQGQPPEEELEGIRIYRVKTSHQRGSMIRYLFEYAASFLMMAALLTRLHFRRRYRMIQVVTMPDFLVFVAAIPKLFGAKVLLDMQEPIPELWMTKFGNGNRLALNLLMAVEKWAIRYADRVVTVNETIKNRFVQRGAPAWKMGLSPNVPDEGVMAASATPVPKTGFTLMTHGTIEPHYNHEALVEAMRVLRPKMKDARLVIIGEGKNKRKLMEMVNEYGLSDVVTFLNWLPYSEIPRHILAADVGVICHQPSPFADLCQPLKLFDYVALQTPVIIPRFQAIQESFDEDCVRFVEPGNPGDLVEAIRELYKNPQKRRELAKNAYAKYESALKWTHARRNYLASVDALVPMDVLHTGGGLPAETPIG